MNLTIKTKGSQPISDRDKNWAQAKFRKLAKLCSPESTIEVTLEDMFGPKGGQDKRVHVLANIPHTKQPFYLEETSTNLRQAITSARSRLERYLIRSRDRQLDDSRRPRKAWFTRLFNRAENTGDEQDVA